MIIDRPGPVTDRITLLGRTESCVYLVKGDLEYAVLGGGLAYIAPEVLAQLEAFQVDQEKIKRLIVHHTHFDHVGIVPFLRKRWPWLKVMASARGREQLARREVVATIIAFSQALLAQKGLTGRLGEFGLDPDGFQIDETAPDGGSISLGGLTLRFIYTPGHSSCSMAVYIPEEKVLSASDGGGIPFGDRVFASANSNFDQYQESLVKMAGLDVQIHLAEHYGARTGEDGRSFLARSIESARLTRSALEESYARTRDEEKTVEELSSLLAGEASGYFLPQEVMDLVLRQMTRFIARKHNAVKRGG
ncbi:MAG: MBL fold metallo-hydrolase [Thermodesulfobacteriota bacterium]